MSGNFYPLPTSPGHFNSVHPRELLPLREPPPSLLLYPPILSSEAARRSKTPCTISNDYALSTHLVPAAYPRITPFVPLPADNATIHSDTLSKEERRDKVKKVTEEIKTLKERQLQGEFPPDDGENRLLWNCVTRYYRKSSPPDGRKSVTLLLTHANGFPKETWESFLRQLIANVQRSGNGSVSVEEVWAFEAVQHGDSAIINQDKLGSVYDWSDNTRDILNFLTRYIPSHPATEEDLPVHLPRLSDEVERSRLQNGFAGGHTLVAIGHSFGGATAALGALTTPRLFSRLVLVDPVIIPPYVDRSNGIYKLAAGAIQRRHEWANREEARRLFGASPFFAAWDPAVLDNYIEFGLTPMSASSQGVKLKMPGIQEAVVFVESRVSYEVFERLKDLNPRIAVHWVMAGRESWITGSEAATRDLVWRRPVNSTNTQIASSGHLIVQEAPKELAHEIHAFLERALANGSRSRL